VCPHISLRITLYMFILTNLHQYMHTNAYSCTYVEPLFAAVCTDAAAELTRRYLSQFILENVVILVYIHWFILMYIYQYIKFYVCGAVVGGRLHRRCRRAHPTVCVLYNLVYKRSYADLGNIYILLGRSLYMSVLIDLYPNIYIYIRISSFTYLEPLLAAVCTDAAAQLARRYLSQFILENVVILVYIHWFILMYIYQYI